MYLGNAHFNQASAEKSVIDLTIAPVSVVGNFEWEVADELYDSGLYLITVYIM